jgi:hypothetical protein
MAFDFQSSISILQNSVFFKPVFRDNSLILKCHNFGSFVALQSATLIFRGVLFVWIFLLGGEGKNEKGGTPRRNRVVAMPMLSGGSIGFFI